MKTILFSLLLISIISLHAQIDPITIEFYEADPLWEHLVYDTNYYEIDSIEPHKQFTTVYPYLSNRSGDDLIMLNRCFSPNNDYYGYIIEKVGIQTGELIWSDYNTFYNNVETQELISNMFIRPDGNLELLGSMRAGSLIEDPEPLDLWALGKYDSKPIKRKYNINTGERLSFDHCNDSIDWPGVYLPQFPVEFDHQYFVIEQGPVPLSGPFYKDSFAFTFFRIDSTYELFDSTFFDYVVYDTEDSLGYFSIEAHFNVHQLDDSTLVGVIHQDRYEEKYKLQLIWMDISDWNDVKTIRRVNYEDIVPRATTKRRYFRFITKNKHIFLTQHYTNSQLNAYVSYILWVNESGEVQSILPKTTSDEHRYTYIRPLSANDSFAIFFSAPSITGRTGSDILKVHKGSDSLEFLSSITSVHSDEIFQSDMYVHKLFDDGKLLFGAYTRVLGQEPLQWAKYYCFDIEDLGIVLDNKNYEPKHKNIKLYPNPAEDLCYLDLFDFEEKQITLTIFDDFGRKVLSDRFKTGTSHQIDLESIASGIYFLHITDIDRQILRTGKLVKL